MVLTEALTVLPVTGGIGPELGFVASDTSTLEAILGVEVGAVGGVYGILVLPVTADGSTVPL